MDVLELLIRIDNEIYGVLQNHAWEGMTDDEFEEQFADIQFVIRDEVARAGAITGTLIGSSVLDEPPRKANIVSVAHGSCENIAGTIIPILPHKYR